jgi:hypothetical protein
VATVLPGRIPEELIGKDVVLVGRMDRTDKVEDEPVLIEAIALVPWSASGSSPHLPAVFARQADHLDRLAKLKSGEKREPGNATTGFQADTPGKPEEASNNHSE